MKILDRLGRVRRSRIGEYFGTYGFLGRSLGSEGWKKMSLGPPKAWEAEWVEGSGGVLKVAVGGGAHTEEGQ